MEHLKTAQSRQKSYADPKRRDLTFDIGDFVYLRVTPLKRKHQLGEDMKVQSDHAAKIKLLNKNYAKNCGFYHHSFLKRSLHNIKISPFIT